MYGCLTRTLDRRLSNTTVNRPASFNIDLFDITRRMLAKRMPRYHIRHFHIFFIRYTRYTNLPSYISISFQAVAAATAGALFPVTKTTSTAANLRITPISIFTTLLSYWSVGSLTQMLLQILRPSSLSSSQRDRTQTCR